MILPRFLFLSGAAYTIYMINYNQRQNAKWKNYVTSHRQEEINAQFAQIEKVLRPTENTFEPGKQVALDNTYTGDQYHYRYQREEKDLQDKLFQIYEEVTDDGDEGYGYEEESPAKPQTNQ